MIEVEQKFRVENLDAIRARVKELFDSDTPILYQQSDVYFSHPDRDFGKTDEALRLRVYRDETAGGPPRLCLTYKGPRLETTGAGSEFKMRKEIELELEHGYDNAAKARELLACLGFRPEEPICKRRESLHVSLATGRAEVSLDQVEGLGEFVEIEMIADRQLSATEARSMIEGIASELGLSSPITRSYRNMLKGD